MSTVDIIIVAIFALVAVAFVVWIYLKDRRPKPEPVEPDVPEPVEPDVPDTPDTPDTPDEPEEPVDPEPEPEPIPEPIPEPDPEPEPETDYAGILDEMLKYFASEVNVPKDSYTYLYLTELVKEAYAQYYDRDSVNGIPVLIRQENFPYVFNFYGDKKVETGFQVMLGWMLAMFFAPLKPFRRTAIFKIGYEIGGFDKYSNIYGYKLEEDPNNLRKAAAVLQVAMRSIKQPDDNKMRVDVGGYKYDKNVDELIDSDRNDVKPENFYIDFREILSTALGPYAPG